MNLNKNNVAPQNNLLFLSSTLGRKSFIQKGNSYYIAYVAMIMFCILFLKSEVVAERLQNEIAVFSALDKVTATIKRLEVPINQMAEFGSLKVKPSICYSSPPTEPPKTTSFVEIEEIQLDGQLKKIFSGWMLAESPGLNAVEHPVFDIWLTGCKRPKNNWPPADFHSDGAENGRGSGPISDDLPPTSQRRRLKR